MNKMISLCSAAVVCATGAFADSDRLPGRNSQKNPCACLEQGLGLPKEKKCFPAAYNAPASIAVSCGWDVDVFASFIYWHASQDDMQAALISADYFDTNIPRTNATVTGPDFGYKPGFKVGLGFDTNYDDWTGWVEYTWFHQTVTDSVLPPNTIQGDPGSWLANDWFLGFAGDAGSDGTPVQTSWKMNLDVVDAMFSRPYYQGTQLTVSPYAGLRALFIRQRYTINLTDSLAPGAIDVSTNQSHAWSVGPAAGALGHWLLGMGFRFEGKVAGSLLYTQYTKISTKISTPDFGQVPPTAPAFGSVQDVNTVRPIAELGVGLGWGTYLASQQYFFDLSARYDFMYLWRQNVMRNTLSNFFGYADDMGDLSLHGLTVTAAFDF
jgi:hypothetical protein